MNDYCQFSFVAFITASESVGLLSSFVLCLVLLTSLMHHLSVVGLTWSRPFSEGLAHEASDSLGLGDGKDWAVCFSHPAWFTFMLIPRERGKRSRPLEG